ncbi:MAG: RNA polymerase sigma factor [Fidelibacterota bacterium]
MEKEIKKKQLTDEELIKRFQKGDVWAFEEIVRRYRDRLTNFVYRYVNDRREAEDLVQDTFLKLYQNKHAYKEIAKFSTWIYTIAANLAKTLLRKRKTRKLMFFSHLGPEDKDLDLPSKDRTTQEILESEHGEKIIQQAISKLPEHFRIAIILRDVQELSYEEISNIIGKPIGTVKSRINRARLRLQKELENM